MNEQASNQKQRPQNKVYWVLHISFSTQWMFFIVVELQDLPGSTTYSLAAHRWSQLAVFPPSGFITRCTPGLCAQPWDERLWPSLSLVSCSNIFPWVGCSPVSFRIQWFQLRFLTLGKVIQRKTARTLQIHKLCGNLGPCSSSSVIIAFSDMFHPMVRMACRQKVRFLVVRCGAFDFTENYGAQWKRVPKGAKMFLAVGNITTYKSQDQHYSCSLMTPSPSAQALCELQGSTLGRLSLPDARRGVFNPGKLGSR